MLRWDWRGPGKDELVVLRRSCFRYEVFLGHYEKHILSLLLRLRQERLEIVAVLYKPLNFLPIYINK